MYQIPENHGDVEIVNVQDWLEENFKEEISLDKLTGIGNLGRKTLLRRF